MFKKKEPSKTYSQQVFELRFKPFIEFLDNRGKIADIISDKFDMPEWLVGTNKIDFTTDDKLETCFISFNNLGYYSVNPKTNNYFKERALKFIKIINHEVPDFKLNPILRLGVRSTFLCEYNEGDFESLLKKFKNNYISYNDEKFSFFKAKLSDAGAPYNFKSDIGDFNTLCGPMKQEQYKQFFNDKMLDKLPKLGLFFDIDCHTTDIKNEWNIIADRITKYSERSYNIFENVTKLVINNE